MIEKNWGLMVQPIHAFVTFTNQQAKERCAKYLYKYNPETKETNTHKIEGGFTSLGIELDVEDPPEPDDIIYENLEIVKP